MSIRRVSKIAADGTTLTITFGTHQAKVLSISYGDHVETQQMSHAGSQAIDAETQGTYGVDDGVVKMESLEFRQSIMPLMRIDGFGADQFPIVVTDSHPQFGDDSDLLDRAHFVGLKAARDNSNNVATVEFGIKYQQVWWGNDRRTINRLDMSRPLIPTKF
jgi:hypothetical protein